MKKVFGLIFFFFVASACAGCANCHVYKDRESHTTGLKQTVLKF